ncbi:hypothetical protein PtA15_9A166 [Puccinia triticina]|uniref:Uncharacterized protein n=1 Tax=Puccinia triticina TaxID=208348 RepID=A0ABY7CS07_9BASI|nr:uncharacterized protein PtA15_9A166 [Puccinia triticina]WAQ88041.1 hypothetical protein PtA15_9A166 [Puccinia triticina]WAR60237.1 hypothetical protein PtB15_9B174 [Puccinia triticina]
MTSNTKSLRIRPTPWAPASLARIDGVRVQAANKTISMTRPSVVAFKQVLLSPSIWLIGFVRIFPIGFSLSASDCFCQSNSVPSSFEAAKTMLLNRLKTGLADSWKLSMPE